MIQRYLNKRHILIYCRKKWATESKEVENNGNISPFTYTYFILFYTFILLILLLILYLYLYVIVFPWYPPLRVRGARLLWKEWPRCGGGCPTVAAAAGGCASDCWWSRACSSAQEGRGIRPHHKSSSAPDGGEERALTIRSNKKDSHVKWDNKSMILNVNECAWKLDIRKHSWKRVKFSWKKIQVSYIHKC